MLMYCMPECAEMAPRTSSHSHQAERVVRRYAELLSLAKGRHAIIPPAFRIEDATLARTIAAGA